METDLHFACDPPIGTLLVTGDIDLASDVQLGVIFASFRRQG